MIGKSKAKQRKYMQQYMARRRAGVKAGLRLKPKPSKPPTAWTRGIAWLQSNITPASLPLMTTTASIGDRIPISVLPVNRRRAAAGRFLASIGATQVCTCTLHSGAVCSLWCVRPGDLSRCKAMTQRQRIGAAGERPPDRTYPPQCVPVWHGDEVTGWRPLTVAERSRPDALDDPGNDSTPAQPSPSIRQTGPGGTDGPLPEMNVSTGLPEVNGRPAALTQREHKAA